MTNPEYNLCVDLYSDALYRFLLKSFQNHRNEAEDSVQNAFETLWLNVEKVEFAKAKSYLFTVAYRDLLDHTRKMNLKLNMENDHVPLNSSGTYYNGLNALMEHALIKLPSIQKTVIMLRDFEGYDYASIGRITGLSESQVKVYIFRARQALKKYFVSVDKVI